MHRVAAVFRAPLRIRRCPVVSDTTLPCTTAATVGQPRNTQLRLETFVKVKFSIEWPRFLGGTLVCRGIG
jgi:hypothetical protein